MHLPLMIGLLAGCESLDERSQYLTGADAIEWPSDSDFTVAAQPDMKGHLNLNDGVLSVYLTGFPPGTQATLGTQTVAVRDNGAANLQTEMTVYFGTVSTDDFLRGKVEGASLQVEAPGQAAFALPLPAQDALLLDKHLLAVTEGPLLYLGEEAVAVRPPKTLFWNHGATNEILGAPAATLGQIDAIAVLGEAPAGERVCPGYQGDDGSIKDLTLELTEYTVTIYDRRTGETLGAQGFAPIDQCPTSTFEFDGQSFKTKTVMPEDPVRAWLEAQLG